MWRDWLARLPWARVILVPYLIKRQQPKAITKQLTEGEARVLQDILAAVVNGGSGSCLGGVATGAKTGTAEYGTDKPPRTHAWIIAYADDLAVAVFIADGESASGTAGPLLKKFLS